MVDDIDIYRATKVLIDQHGDNALIQAAVRFDAATAQGDMEGRRVWQRIEQAIRTLAGTDGTRATHH